jgi:hypothetical protein
MLATSSSHRDPNRPLRVAFERQDRVDFGRPLPGADGLNQTLSTRQERPESETDGEPCCVQQLPDRR